MPTSDIPKKQKSLLKVVVNTTDKEVQPALG